MFEVELENRLSLLPRPSLLQKHLEWRKKNLPIYYEEVYEELKKVRGLILLPCCIGFLYLRNLGSSRFSASVRWKL